MTKKILDIEAFTWAICPECGCNFLLDDKTYRITGRDELPPSILSLLSDSVASEKLAPSSELNRHQSEVHTQNYNQDTQPFVQPELEKKATELDIHTEDKEQPQQAGQEDLQDSP